MNGFSMNNKLLCKEIARLNVQDISIAGNA